MDEVMPTRGPMPKEIAEAVVKIMAGANQLGFDEKNTHGGYSYASIDKFLASLRPLCAKHGLVILLDETGCEFKEGPPREDNQGRPRPPQTYAFLEYAVWLIVESATWGPLTRRLALPATGPQSFGAAESYVLKRFMRNLFQIPTGEKDADDLAEGDIPAGRSGARQRAKANARQRAKANWGGQDSGTASQPIPRPGNGAATPPHDPVTGEVKPVEVPVPMVGDKNDFLSWGQRMMAGIKTATTGEELDEWERLNEQWFAFAKGTAALRSVTATLAQAREGLAPAMVTEETAGSVLG
jgi:hypothetical protein